MWAYITFMGLSVLLRFFIEYEFWNPIVLSITLSSMFFAFEDLFSLLYQTQKKSCDITENFVSNARTKKQEDLSFFLEMDEKIEQYKDIRQNLVELEDLSHSPRKRIEEVLLLIDGLEELNLKDREKEKSFKRVSHIFAYTGFLLLFVSLIGSTLISIPLLIQEIITVVSFAIILITQQINNHFIEKIEMENKENKELLQEMINESDKWVEVKEKFEELIEHIDKDSMVKEVRCNAD